MGGILHFKKSCDTCYKGGGCGTSEEKDSLQFAICPGHLHMPMTQGQYEDSVSRTVISPLTPWGNEWGHPADVAKAAVFLPSDDAAYVTGIALPIDGGYTAQ